MFTSFSTALSALGAHATAVDVVGNNLANLNTPGFKTSVVSFHDLVTQSLGAGLGETQVGFGVGRPVTLRQFSQGAIQTSSGQLDAAIQGDGFFIVKESGGALLYTRGGNFQVDKSGHLLSSTGEMVQGWTNINGAVNTNGAIGDIVVPVGTLRAPKPSTSFSFDLNLNAVAPQGETFSSAIEVFDSLGGSHILSVNFTKSATAGQWDLEVTVPGDEVAGGTAGTPFVAKQASVTFDGTGTMTDPVFPDDIVLDPIPLANLAPDLEITWSLFHNGAPRLTQYAQKSAVSANAQDGSAAAQLIRVGVADAGKVLAQYSNGQQIVVGQLALASVRNPESLIAVGNNNYQLSARTALPAIGEPGTGGRGKVLGGAVEHSTVDIAREFTNLIVLQRGYQANSRVVITVDELSQETINLKR
jgi:flagellar hook protein FlgE